MMKIAESISKSVEKEFEMFETEMLKQTKETVFNNAHKIDIYEHLKDFLTDIPGEYLNEYELGCLSQRKDKILEELYEFSEDNTYVVRYSTYDDCSDLIEDYIKSEFEEEIK